MMKNQLIIYLLSLRIISGNSWKCNCPSCRWTQPLSVNFPITPFWLEPTFRAVRLGFEDRAVVGEASGPGGCSVGTGSPSWRALSAFLPNLPPPPPAPWVASPESSDSSPALLSQPLQSQAPTQGTPFLPISPKKDLESLNFQLFGSPGVHHPPPYHCRANWTRCLPDEGEFPQPRRQIQEAPPYLPPPGCLLRWNSKCVRDFL